MKVLQVNKFFYMKGGSEAYLFSLIDGLKAYGVDVAEFAMKDPENLSSNWEQYFVSEINYETKSFLKKIRFAGKIIYSIEAKNKIAGLLDIFKPDIVHLHIFQHQLSASILPEIKKRNIPIIYTAHDLKSVCPNYKMLAHGRVCEACKGHKYYNCLRSKCVKGSSLKSAVNVIEMYFHLWRRYYDLIDLIITPSNFYREKLVEWRFPPEKVIHVPNFIDEEKFRPSYEHKDYFIYLGRLSEEKGIMTLLNAMKKVPKGRLVIIGTGPLEKEVRDTIEYDELSNVELVGFQSGEALNNYIRSSMFSVIPSEWYENGSISLLENFASGKPVIGANIGGIPEHISYGVDGLIFRSRDPDDLAEKINSLFDAPEKLADMGKAARNKVERLYSKKNHINSIIDIYDHVYDTFHSAGKGLREGGIAMRLGK